MARADGRIEPGQSIASAISARAWNRAQDAADMVLGSRPGITAGEGYSAPHRVIVTMRKIVATQSIYPGHALEFYLDTKLQASNAASDYLVAADWPATSSTFEQTIDQASSRPYTDEKKAEMAERQKWLAHLGPYCPTYSCRLIQPAAEFSGEEIDFFPNVGVAVSASESGESAVRVCISGPALVYVRYLTSNQLSQPNGCAIRPRSISGISGNFANATGCLDAHRGGNIRILHAREFSPIAPSPPPFILLTPVML